MPVLTFSIFSSLKGSPTIGNIMRVPACRNRGGAPSDPHGDAYPLRGTWLWLGKSQLRLVNPARSTGPVLFVHGLALHQLWLFWIAPDHRRGIGRCCLFAALQRGIVAWPLDEGLTACRPHAIRVDCGRFQGETPAPWRLKKRFRHVINPPRGPLIIRPLSCNLMPCLTTHDQISAGRSVSGSKWL